jgi:hypothetical protein
VGAGIKTTSVYTPNAVIGNFTGTTENIDVYFTVTGGDAVEGVDYDWLVDPGQRAIPVLEGQLGTTLPFEVLGTYTPGRYMHVALAHERSGRADENIWTYSEDTGPYESRRAVFGGPVTGGGPDGRILPGEPTEWIGAGVGSNPTPTVQFTDSIKTYPWYHNTGNVMGLRLTEDAAAVGYARKSFEGGVFCGATPVAWPVVPYARFSTYVDYPTDISYTEWCSFRLRNRNIDTAFAIDYNTFEGFSGSPGQFWTGEGSDYGTVTGLTEKGEPYTRIWFIYNEEETGRYGDFNNILVYPVSPVHHTISEGIGSGLLIYGTKIEFSTGELTGPPAEEYFPRLDNAWEPRGFGVLNSTGFTQTITLS